MPITVVDRREKPFFVVPTDLVDKYLTVLSGDAMKFMVYLHRAEDFPEQSPDKSLLEILDWRPSQLLSVAAELKRHGLITVTEDKDDTLYCLTEEEEETSHVA